MPFDNNYTLNTVDICPVGALTSKDFRFKMRVFWAPKETKSVCTSCATGCNIIIGSREEKIQRYYSAKMTPLMARGCADGLPFELQMGRS